MDHAPIELRPLHPPLLRFVATTGFLIAVAAIIAMDPRVAFTIRIVTPIACALGISLTWLWWGADRRRRFVIDGTGIRQQRLIGQRSISWDEITHYRYLSVNQPAVAHGRGGAGLLGLVSGALEETSQRRRERANGYFGLGYLELRGEGTTRPLRIGKHPFFGPTGGYVELSALFELLFAELHARLAASERFTPWMLRGDRLGDGAGHTIALAEIAAVRIGDGRLQLVPRDAPPWPAAPMKAVDNWVLLVSRLAARGVQIAAAPEVFLPASR